MMRTFLVCAIMAFCLTCTTENENDYQNNNSDDITLSAEIILSIETDDIIANPTRITAFNDGFILYDNALNQILIFSESGDHIQTFGRQGRGPGEFLSISSLKFVSGKIIVSDSELLRLTSFDLSGNHLSSQDLTASLFAFDNTVISPTQFITPTNGQEGGLAKFVDRENNIEFVFGEAVTTPPGFADLNQLQRDLSSGRVPDFFRNRVAISGDETFFYLFLQTEGILQQYSNEGVLIWEKKFELPEFDDEFNRFVEQNRNNPPGRMYMLQYVHIMEHNEEGVFMLLRIPNNYPPTILYANHDGEDQRKFHFNEMEYRPSHFSISPSKEWIYFLNTSHGIVYRSSFPD